MAADQMTHPAAQPPVASGARLNAAVLRPSRLAALTAELRTTVERYATEDPGPHAERVAVLLYALPERSGEPEA